MSSTNSQKGMKNNRTNLWTKDLETLKTKKKVYAKVIFQVVYLFVKGHGFAISMHKASFMHTKTEKLGDYR